MAYFEPMDPARGGPMPYRRIKRRSHRSLAVALAIGVMAMSAGGLWVGYRFSVGRTTSGEIPLIHAGTDPIKVKPDDPGGMEIPNRDRFVFNPTGSMPVERLLPPPETPLPRPAPSNMAPQSIGPATLAVVPQTPPSAPAPSPAPAVSAPPPPQIAAVPTPAPGNETKGYRLQIGAVKTPDIAKQELDRIKRQNGDIVGSLPVSVDRADLGQRGVFYRLHIGPIGDAGQAERLCAQLRQRGVGCILAKP